MIPGLHEAQTESRPLTFHRDVSPYKQIIIRYKIHIPLKYITIRFFFSFAEITFTAIILKLRARSPGVAGNHEKKNGFLIPNSAGIFSLLWRLFQVVNFSLFRIKNS
jgi:hypothetical protein